MRIIRGGNSPKDFYDYLQGVLGQDDLVVYDRRKCTPIDANNMLSNTNILVWFSTNPLHSDKKRESIRYWRSEKVSLIDNSDDKTSGLPFYKKLRAMRKSEDVLEGRVFHFLLEIGYHQYIFEVERYLDDDNTLNLKYKILEHRRVEKDKKVSKEPMSLCPVRIRNSWMVKPNSDYEFLHSEVIENPIIASTYLSKCIDAYEVWNNLYEYISSLRDKEIIDSRTNEEHIESNGFDKKSSFRGKR